VNALATRLRHKRGKGERVGNIEFGYRLSADGLHLEEDSAKQAALAEIRRLRAACYSFRAIAGALNRSGHRRSTLWRLESVVRVVKQDAARQARRVA
jgi:site-specific DNA recombinase